MALTLYGHPFSSYSQKVLVALYENGTPFTFEKLGPDNPEGVAAVERLWPIKRIPVLVDDDRPVIESSVIIEHLQLNHSGPSRLIPDGQAALEVRFMDRFFDNYIMAPWLRVAFDQGRPESERDAYGVKEARSQLDSAYGWLNEVIASRRWAAGDEFSLADCAAAPALLFADWVHPIGPAYSQVRSYRTRLLERSSFARITDEARPYRAYFPLGAPTDRD